VLGGGRQARLDFMGYDDFRARFFVKLRRSCDIRVHFHRATFLTPIRLVQAHLTGRHDSVMSLHCEVANDVVGDITIDGSWTPTIAS
jgi:hypothetical protein